MQELLVRIEAAVGRAFVSGLSEPEWLLYHTLGDYQFYPVRQELVYYSVLRPDTEKVRIELSYRESAILRRLCKKREQVVHTQNLLLELWGDDSFFNTSLHVFITKLRHKLAYDSRTQIINVRGIEYRLMVQE